MENWKDILNVFIADYFDKDYVIGIVLAGSYASGNYTFNSDIDVHIITNNVTWKERGNKILDGKMIEYFINPINELYKYMEEDYFIKRRVSTASMIAYGEILLDKTGDIKILKEKALDYYNKRFLEIDPIQVMCNNYMCWDLMDELKDKLKNGDDFEFNYFLLLKELISTYFYNNYIATVPFTKIEKLFRDREFREKYHLKNFPDDMFVELVLNCFDNKDINDIEILFTYVIGDFNITDFLLITEM